MKLIIITGKLGSGKTTVLNNLIRDVDKEKTSVVINEFAKSGMDKHFVSMSVNELNEGCVCCSKGEELKGLLKKLEDKETVFLETSGVSSLNQLLERLSEDYEEVAEVIMVLDAYKLSKAKMSKDTEKNIRLSTTILVNKTDLIKKEETKEIVSKIRKINRNANIITTKYGGLSFRELPLNGRFLKKKQLTKTQEFMYWLFPELKLDKETKHIQKERLTSISLNLDGVDLKKFEKILKNDGSVIRAKGFLKGLDGNTYRFNYASDLLYLENYDKDVETSFVVIGKFNFFKKRRLKNELIGISKKIINKVE